VKWVIRATIPAGALSVIQRFDFKGDNLMPASRARVTGSLGLNRRVCCRPAVACGRGPGRNGKNSLDVADGGIQK